MAPTPERNLIQDSSVPSTAEPMAAPRINCATVPTTISDSAVETRSQIENRLAIKARPSHNAARAQIPVIRKPPSVNAHDGDAQMRAGPQRPVLEAVGEPGRAPTDAKRLVGVISLGGGYGGLHPQYALNVTANRLLASVNDGG